MAGHLTKMNELYQASFDDDADVWNRCFWEVQQTSINICVVPPQKKKDVLNDVHSIVVASAVTAKVCKDFIVANSLSVRDNKLFTSLEGDNNQLADAHQGDVNQWQGIGLGRFMMQFLAFYHYQHYSKAVPILVQIATNNVKAKV